MDAQSRTELGRQPRGLGVFEKYLTVWVILCIAAGIVLGKAAPGVATFLDGLAVTVGGAARDLVGYQSADEVDAAGIVGSDRNFLRHGVKQPLVLGGRDRIGACRQSAEDVVAVAVGGGADASPW